MLLSAWNLEISEKKLRELADCTPLGTDAFQLIEAARALGFETTQKHTLESIDDLVSLLSEGLFPIVYVDLWPMKGGPSGQYHSLVVESVTSENVTVLDPLSGSRSLSRGEFRKIWLEMRCLTIVVSP